MFGFPLSIGTIEAILDSSGNTLSLKLSFITIVKGLERKSVETLTSFEGIISKPTLFLMIIFFKSLRTYLEQ